MDPIIELRVRGFDERDVMPVILIGRVNFGEGGFENFLTRFLLAGQAANFEVDRFGGFTIELELEDGALGTDFLCRGAEMKDRLAHHRIQSLVGQGYLIWG